MADKPPPTLVSTFEILFTPQLPPGLGPTQVAQIDEVVVKGFFLTIANPNPTAFRFTLGFHCNVNPTSTSSERTLASAVGFLDDGSAGSPLPIMPGATPDDFSATVAVSARGTVLVGILPAFFNTGGLVSATIESRGWVDITLPALLTRKAGHFPAFEPQSNVPVSVLLTPEQRLTFLPMANNAASAVEAQSAFALPLASGAGAVEVPPQPGRPFITLPLDAMATADALPQDALPALGQMAQASAPQMAALLGMLIAASPTVREGKISTKEALESLGFTS